MTATLRKSLFSSSSSLLSLALLAACHGGTSGADPNGPQPDGNATLEAVQYGRLVDVYGLRSVRQGEKKDVVAELYQSDMLVGPDIQDQRPSNSELLDHEIVYDYIRPNPDTLQPRLLITREIGSEEFEAALEALDDGAGLIVPNQFGRDVSRSPYSVVPRNACLRLSFARNLGIDDNFFVDKDEQNRIIGIKNSEAVQLLKIVGDPNDKKPGRDFQVIPTRITVRGKQIFIDPVILGSEGLGLGAKNTASGMPASADQVGANIRLAVALEGTRAIAGIREDKKNAISGLNNSAVHSVIRDFRSGNRLDNSPNISRGFLRDSVPPKLVGHLLMYLERVDVAGVSRVLTIYKAGIEHEIDRGDVLRLLAGGSATPSAVVEVLHDPEDDLGAPKVQHVRLQVRPVLGLSGEDILEALDPSNLKGYPTGPGQARNEFLLRSAPSAVLVAEFTRRRAHPGGGSYGDDPRYFLNFNPRPIQEGQAFRPNQNVSPFAGAVVRFSKPVDMATARGLDSMFFATRNVLDQKVIDQFIADRNMEPSTFAAAKYRTPHLVYSRAFDEDGTQATIRLQPTLGFYLDEAMRTADRGKPFEERKYNYFLHLVGGAGGVRDLSGNPLDFQSDGAVTDGLVLEFSLDVRKHAGSNKPRQDDNIVVYSARRFASSDEDERPNYYLPGEVTPPGGCTPADGFRNDDLFGAAAHLATGELIARQTARVTKVADDRNQVPAASQGTILRWCPDLAAPRPNTSLRPQIVNPTATTRFGAPVQNPLNPYGCRLQAVWREIDMSLSRTDPLDFNLDVEQMYWAPFTAGVITFDEFDRVSLFLGHSEFRPEPCIDTLSAFPSMPFSGLFPDFKNNYARNMSTAGQVKYQPAAHPAYVNQVLTINATSVIQEPNRINRFLPLPKFDATKKQNFANSLFVWRDETEIVQGGVNGLYPSLMRPYPYIISPFLAGMGRRVTGAPCSLEFQTGGWYNGRNLKLSNPTGTNIELYTDGLVGALALPLLADFWTYPDSAELPEEDPFLASGVNGWQVSLAVTSSPQPNFRVYSAGWGGGAGTAVTVDPTSPKWKLASGGFTPAGQPVRPGDNSLYWIMTDFLKRTTVVTSGFVEILNPHRMPQGGDPRLGPYVVPQGHLPDFAFDFEPPLGSLSPGAAVVPEFRGAGRVDPNPWAFLATGNRPDAGNFPLDPLKAGDAHIRHYDDRGNRSSWTYLYNKNITGYTQDPNEVVQDSFTKRFAGPNEEFWAKDVQYFNWRFLMRNNVEASPPVSPKIESCGISYPFVRKKTTVATVPSRAWTGPSSAPPPSVLVPRSARLPRVVSMDP